MTPLRTPDGRIIDDAFLAALHARVPPLLEALTPRIVDRDAAFLVTAEDLHARLPALTPDALHEVLLMAIDEHLPSGEPILGGFERRDHVFMVDPTPACRRRLREAATAAALAAPATS